MSNSPKGKIIRIPEQTPITIEEGGMISYPRPLLRPALEIRHGDEVFWEFLLENTRREAGPHGQIGRVPLAAAIVCGEWVLGEMGSPAQAGGDAHLSGDTAAPCQDLRSILFGVDFGPHPDEVAQHTWEWEGGTV